MRDPYAVLGLESPATAEEVRAAYRARSMLLHPDLHEGRPAGVRREAERAMAQLSEAYEALTRPIAGDPATATAPYRLGRLLARSGIAGRPTRPRGTEQHERYAYRLGRLLGRRPR